MVVLALPPSIWQRGVQCCGQGPSRCRAHRHYQTRIFYTPLSRSVVDRKLSNKTEYIRSSNPRN